MKTTHRKTLSNALLAAFALVFLRAESCGRDLVRNPGFDLWCGETLCDWTAEGDVARVPTWHRHDYGVALEGDPSSISQLADLTGGPADCFHFELLVRKSDRADVFLQMDFEDDGSVEYSQPIPAGDWTPVEYDVKPPDWYSAVRFIVLKRGPGTAVLAQIRIRTGGECLGEPVRLAPRPLRASCNTNDDCESGVCSETWDYFDMGSVCSTCAGDADCDAGDVCGLAVSEAGEWRACQPRGERAIGERCAEDDECGGGADPICGLAVSEGGAWRTCQPRAERVLGERCVENGECGGGCAARVSARPAAPTETAPATRPARPAIERR